MLVTINQVTVVVFITLSLTYIHYVMHLNAIYLFFMVFLFLLPEVECTHMLPSTVCIQLPCATNTHIKLKTAYLLPDKNNSTKYYPKMKIRNSWERTHSNAALTDLSLRPISDVNALVSIAGVCSK